ncbi:hypothetical protein BaRGS_00027942 [Batillaria attramentaria]|uniref:Uncharacterized protein n=1 Tax=Batillaria attramentaria TaxID=370345 RepID=A0ABD0K176_9CAEN
MLTIPWSAEAHCALSSLSHCLLLNTQLVNLKPVSLVYSIRLQYRPAAINRSLRGKQAHAIRDNRELSERQTLDWSELDTPGTYTLAADTP